MELVNKFDNALAGVAGDAGSDRPARQRRQLPGDQVVLEDEDLCPSAYGDGVHDNEQPARARRRSTPSSRTRCSGRSSTSSALQPPGAPVYGPAAPHCNQRGLTTLGEHTIRGMAKRHMIFDPDHMSVKARKSSLDLLEKLQLPRRHLEPLVVDARRLPAHLQAGRRRHPVRRRLHRLRRQVEAAREVGRPALLLRLRLRRRHQRSRRPGRPAGADAPNPVTYPFTGWGGVTVNKQVSGERIYDINVDGVAHYGLYPDWWQDLPQRRPATRHHDRTCSAAPRPTCRCGSAPSASPTTPAGSRRWPRGLPVPRPPAGLTVQAGAPAGGQPHERLGDTFTYCARTPSGGAHQVTQRFTAGGRLV